MSLHSVQKHYRVTFDSTDGNSFRVYLPDNTVMRFRPTAKGLYAYCASNNRPYHEAWAFISTVADQRDKYTRRAYQAAKEARRLQNIIGFPSSRQYAAIVAHNMLPNCPVVQADINAADDIFGPNIGALKGKTTDQKPDPVLSEVELVPRDILKTHQHVTLAIDIMFINKIPFFVTTSTKLHFSTVENLNDRQTSTVADCIKTVLRHYMQRGFRPTLIKADNEFSKLQALVPCQFNYCGQDEHVPEIERYIRTLKDRTRSGYNVLPFKYIPRMMLIQLVKVHNFWLNSFPHRDGVSSTLSPRYIMTGQKVDCAKHALLEFGAYVQTHESHDNTMQPRTVSAVCLGPSGNSQGGHHFLSLVTGRRITRTKNQWTSLPMPDEVIERVSEMGRKQGMPRSLTFADRLGHELPDAFDAVDDDHDSDYSDSDEDDVSLETDTDDTSETDDGSTSSGSTSFNGSDTSSDDSDSSDDDSGDPSSFHPTARPQRKAQQPAGGVTRKLNTGTDTPSGTQTWKTVRRQRWKKATQRVRFKAQRSDGPLAQSIFSDSDDSSAPAPPPTPDDTLQHNRYAALFDENDSDSGADSDIEDEYSNGAPVSQPLPPKRTRRKPTRFNPGTDTAASRWRDAEPSPAMEPGVRAADSEVRAADSGVRAADSGVRATDSGVQATDSGVPTDTTESDKQDDQPDPQDNDNTDHNDTIMWTDEMHDVENYIHQDRHGSYESLYTQFSDDVKDLDGPEGIIMLTEQMSLKRGLKLFGVKGEDAVIKEMQQLHRMNVIEPVHRHHMSKDDLKRALNYLMF